MLLTFDILTSSRGLPRWPSLVLPVLETTRTCRVKKAVVYPHIVLSIR